MEQEISLQDAVQVLKKQYRERAELGPDEGRNLFADTLEHALNVSSGDAQQIVRDLEAARSIRWVETAVEEGTEDTGPAIVAPGTFDQDSARIVARVPARGHWKL